MDFFKNQCNYRCFLSIDKEEYLLISKIRKFEIGHSKISSTFKQKISGFNNKKELELFLVEVPQLKGI